MSVERVFLGWDTPPVQIAASLLLDRFSTEDLCDLRSKTVVTPGRRVGRRLLELLVFGAEARGLRLVPPQITTIGALPEQLYQSALPLADETRELLTWIQAIEQAPEFVRHAILPTDQTDWKFATTLEIAAAVRSLWVNELSTIGISFLDIPTKSGAGDEFLDNGRWVALESVFTTYQQLLSESGFVDRYLERRRVVEEQALSSNPELLFFACADIKPTTIELLQLLESEVVVLVSAPEAEADSFCEFGTVLDWAGRYSPISDSQLVFTTSPRAQADAVVREMGKVPTGTKTEEIVLGTCDAELAPYICEALESIGIGVHSAEGVPLLQTPIGELFKALLKLVQVESFENLASFVRHPLVLERVSQVVSRPLSALDQLYQDHLPSTVDSVLSRAESRESSVLELVQLASELVAPFNGTSNKPVRGWIEATVAFLHAVYQNKRIVEPRLKQSLESTQEVFEALLSQELTTLSATDFLTILVYKLREVKIPDYPTLGEVELLGWLETVWDDAPHCYICGMNDGYLPEEPRIEPFLPDSLRHALGLTTRERRIARDAYFLHILAHSKTTLCCIAGVHSPAGDPLSASKLLLRLRGKELAVRVLKFCEAHRERSGTTVVLQEVPSLLPIPDRSLYRHPVTRMSATGFEDYLDCPYQYYLKHVLKLRSQNDSPHEMEALLFGNFCHSVLAIAIEALRTWPASATIEDIAAVFSQTLDAQARAVFGSSPRPVVRIQIEQLRGRLLAYAVKEYEWRKAGWKVYQLEDTDQQFLWKLPLRNGETMEVVGRFDRIDRRSEKEFAIIDYKTGERTDLPNRINPKGKVENWKKFQLPAYYHIFRSEFGEVEPELHLAQLHGSPASVTLSRWDYLPGDLELAKGRMTEIAQQIFDGIFMPPNPDSIGGRDFARILSAIPESDDEEGAEYES